MKKLIGIFIIFGCVLAAPVLKLHAQQSFEGTITWSMTMPIMGDEDKHPMLINIKGKKTEVEMDMGAMGTMKTYTDDDTKKTYIVQGTMGFIMDMAKDSDIKKASQNQFDSIDLKSTGKKETIDGHSAEEYLLTGIKMKGMTLDMSIWAAGDFPKDLRESLYHSMSTNPNQDGKQKKAMKLLFDKGQVPIRTVMKKGDDVVVTMDFVKYEQKSLNDALFVPPSDIKFSPMPKMSGGGMN